MDDKKVATPEKQVDISEHLVGVSNLSSHLNVQFNPESPTSSQGLSTAEAQARLARDGLNQLNPPKKKHPFLKFLDHLLGLFNLLLILSGVVCYILFALSPAENSSYLGGILIGVAIMNAGIEFYQVQKSAAILESFLNLIPAKCYAIRDGTLAQTEAVELVRGDVVYIRSGDKIPADVVVFSANDFKVDNSSLTGESDPQERTPKNTQRNPLEATNLAFNGTLAVNGEAYGIVIRTGDTTVIGQIASLTANEERRESPLSNEIEHFVKIIAAVAGIVAIVFFVIGMVVKKQSLSAALNFAIGTFVSFVPEGLPATVTMLLTIAAKRMAGRNVLVKDLQGVETLGAITLLATDKTGTLTRNQMTVTYIWAGLKMFYAQSQSSTEAQEAAPLNIRNPAVNEMLHMAVLSSRARFETNEGPISERPIIGDATESGLLRCAALKLPNFNTARDEFPKIFEIPFNSENKWAMTIHKKRHANGHFMLYVKGAPERVLRICSSVFDGENVISLTEEHQTAFHDTYTFMASKGHRVLAFAALALPGDAYPADYVFTKDPANYPSTNLTFYGLMSLEDPPKHGVREAVGHCRAAGVKVMMVTGDHPLTAEAIGRKINLMLHDTRERIAAKRKCDVSQVPEHEAQAIVIHGEKIDSLTDHDWDVIFSKEEIIFARTSPKHKLQIVKRAQSIGHIVGVTGDGVNDSPALKKADLGIAMNQSGSDVSKEAAAMILVDDNFASTVNGIEEGRLIFQNLKKSIQYTVTHTMPEVYANLLYILVPLPIPLTTVLILVVDLGFELLIALSYAWDPPETRTGLMRLQPRKPVTKESIKRIRDREREGRPENESGLKGMLSRFTAKSDEEVLVDGNLLSWSYLEAGSIMTVGCLATYFLAMYYHFGVTPYDAMTYAEQWGKEETITLRNGSKLSKQEQLEALAIGQSGYYLAIMIQQCFNFFICKARLGLPVGMFMFANLYNFAGMFVGAAFTMALVYIPIVNVAFGTDYRFMPVLWLYPMAMGLLLFVYAIIRTAILRARNPIKYSKEIHGLQMHATVMSE